MNHRMDHSSKGAARAFTLVEVAVSTVVIGAMLAAVLTLAAGARVQRQAADDRARAMGLATSLMAEILARRYHDPSPAQQASPTIGLDVGEVAGDRSTFNDMDDYDAYTQSPPRDLAGVVLPGFDGVWGTPASPEWRWEVSVRFVDAMLPRQPIVNDAEAKAIEVRVLRRGRILATLHSVRARGVKP